MVLINKNRVVVSIVWGLTGNVLQRGTEKVLLFDQVSKPDLSTRATPSILVS